MCGSGSTTTKPVPAPRIFSVSPQSRSLFSASFQTFCLTARAHLNTQKYGLYYFAVYAQGS